MKSNATSPGSLSGIRILDMATVLAAPLGATLCADHGAEVVKLELPDGSDALRALPPVRPDTRSGGRSRTAASAASRSTCASRAAARCSSVLPSFDVLVENFRTGTMDSWGLNRDAAPVNPRLSSSA